MLGRIKMFTKRKKTHSKLIYCTVTAILTAGILGTTAMAGDGTALTSQLRSMKDSSYEGTGTSEDPYRIAVAGNVTGSNTAFTAPSAFWAGDNGSGVSENAVVFEIHEGDTVDGKLLSSMAFDMGKNKTDIWDGSWSSAFRLAPWTAFDTSDGQLKLGFCYKGNFSVYFTDWEFKFDVQDLTSVLSEEEQIEPGDTVSLTYIGGYDENQTNRGTNYKIDFSDEDQDVASTVEATVDKDGYAAFSGENQLVYGGNYLVQKVEEDISINITNNDNSQIVEKGGTLQLNASVSSGTVQENEFIWSIVKNKELATIDENGLLKAIGNGDVTVRATLASDPSVYTECTIHISGQTTGDSDMDNSDINNPDMDNPGQNPVNDKKDDVETTDQLSGDSNNSAKQKANHDQAAENTAEAALNDIPKTEDAHGMLLCFAVILGAGAGIMVIRRTLRDY